MFGRRPSDETYLGLTRTEAEQRLAHDERAEVWRIYDAADLAGKDVLSNADYRHDRLNLRVVDGVVTAAEWF